MILHKSVEGFLINDIEKLCHGKHICPNIGSTSMNSFRNEEAFLLNIEIINVLLVFKQCFVDVPIACVIVND